MSFFSKLQHIFQNGTRSSREPRSLRGYPLIVAAILIAGMTIRVYYWEVNCQVPLRDGVNYLRLIEGWHTETIEFVEIYSAHHQAAIPLLFMALSQSLMSFHLSAEIAGTLVNMLFGLGTLLLLWRAGRERNMNIEYHIDVYYGQDESIGES